MTTRLADVIAVLEQLAPPELAESWDNVGLLIGRTDAEVQRVMTCLTLTPDVAAEAIARECQLIVSHHPILFHAVQRLTDQTGEGRMLLSLIEAGVSVYSPHTSYDSAAGGINRQLAGLFELTDIDVLRPVPETPVSPDVSDSSSGGDVAAEDSAMPVGGGRCGNLPQPITLKALCELVKQQLGISAVQFVGDPEQSINRLGLACGSAAEFLPDAARIGCQALLTGEARFHACLEARGLSMALILPGHYASERPAVEQLARLLATAFPQLSVSASTSETDPLQWC